MLHLRRQQRSRLQLPAVVEMLADKSVRQDRQPTAERTASDRTDFEKPTNVI